LAINLRKAGFSALDVADGTNSQGWIVGFGTTFDGRINAFLAIPVGVTADPPGGADAPVFDSGAIIGTAWFGVGWFCPPNLWQPPWPSSSASVADSSEKTAPYTDPALANTAASWWYANSPAHADSKANTYATPDADEVPRFYSAHWK